jgi:xanthine dehydrogenase accessory factor
MAGNTGVTGIPAQARACLTTLASLQQPVVLVTLVSRVGSTPQDIGAKMLVDADGRLEGTVGGGRIEQRAIAEAQTWLASAHTDVTTPPCLLREWNLQRDIGMTCGGVVTLLFEAFNVAPWRVVLFGAGHVAQALVRSLLLLDCHVVCIDSRPEWLQKLPAAPRLSTVQLDDLRLYVPNVRAQDAVICMTMGHATDQPILHALYAQDLTPAYLGVIGSDAKRKALEKGLRALGVSDSWLARLRCPVGLPIGGNQPGEIAISVAAELVALRHTVAAE